MGKKNLWVLPTENSSRLYLGDNGNFVFGMLKTSIKSRNDDFTNQNIYITNDEEIKKGDWVTNGKKYAIKCYLDWFVDFFKTDRHIFPYKKIILTTSEDLIKDGVQAIDDSFLEWFVKNPSCEEVEIINTFDYIKKDYVSHSGYKIQITKENNLKINKL